MGLRSSSVKAGLIERILYGNDCLYREGRAGYWDLQLIQEKHYVVPTVRGFKVLCDVRGMIQRVNHAEFNAAQMLEAGKVEEVVAAWEQEILAPVVLSGIFTIGFANLQIPGHGHADVFMYRNVTPEDDPCGQITRPHLAIDLGVYLVNAVVRAQEQRNWRKNGCIIEPTWIRVVITRSMMRENYTMLTPEELAQAEKDPRVFVTVENAATAALERWRRIQDEFDRAFTEQSLHNEFLDISTKTLDNNLSIYWAKPQPVNKAAAVLGFREEDGYSDDPYNETISKTRIKIEHNTLDSGTTSDSLRAAKTYYYTFFVKDMTTGVKAGFLRFSVRPPSASEQQKELESLAAEIAWLRSQRQQQPPPQQPPEDLGESVIRALINATAPMEKIEEFMKGRAEDLLAKGWPGKSIDNEIARLREMAIRLLRQHK